MLFSRIQFSQKRTTYGTSAIKKATQLGGLSYGGEAGIRTLGRDEPSPVFKTGAFDHSATSPKSCVFKTIYVLLSYLLVSSTGSGALFLRAM